MTFKATAPAKINLTLDILGKRPDGYHDVEMLMQSVSLADTVELTLTDTEDIAISCSDSLIPCDSRNIVYKCAEAFFKATGIKNTGVSLHIEKVIPSEAGLAGGSADGAATLRLLNIAFDAHLSEKELCEIGSKVPIYLSVLLAVQNSPQAQVQLFTRFVLCPSALWLS